ncbi:squalene--hopene cyclase [Candidatus Vallotia cooleyia]|uniref:squalene--hopene cyclase n=1 Tax=Candidatus Vallotiella adelgis TaxID=1177211 RepID=UPI001D012451|nr:squalene--hopene cyclase [Candidatus Vallotia cooleyia]UDG82637.1 squalene--hopene cyclase [Candidatus Vallotia cooleyia]
MFYKPLNPDITDTPTEHTSTPLLTERLEHAIRSATNALLAAQYDDGHWVFELEADATITAEYVLMVHYLGETPDSILEKKIGTYLRRIQGKHGGWPLFHDGDFDMNVSVKAYFALKMIGDPPDAPHMKHAHDAILAHGGAAKSNVFTRILLALYGVLDWCAVPMMPVEIMLLPRWFPFHLSKVSYWSRTVLVPLLVLQAKRPRARNPHGIGIDEIFVGSPRNVGPISRALHQNQGWFLFFSIIDVLLRRFDRFFPKHSRQKAIDAAAHFVEERLNGEDGLGAIFLAMVYSVLMYDVLGYPPDHPHRAIARKSINKLLVIHDNEAYCQPCLSPVWDTALTAHALIETGEQRAIEHAARGLDWLLPLQILETRGDWISRRANVRPGGWAFQFSNPYYPDVDDTAVVVMAMDRMEKLQVRKNYSNAINRACEWVVGMQSYSGGWGAFEPENTHLYLNNIPFSDHGALLDPPTADVSARCLSMLSQLSSTPQRQMSASRAKQYLIADQQDNGSWYGRWGMNYIYGTWSALCGLRAAGITPDTLLMRRAAQWLRSIQNPDGSWGENGDSYTLNYCGHKRSTSTASQTAWALLGLMSAGCAQDAAVARGVAYLLNTQNDEGLWDELLFTATGFPRVFYLRYHGYRKFFPLWALARYRNLTVRNECTVACGI